MHLTNSLFQDSQDEKSSSFSKYVAKDGQQLMYDSSNSYNSETLLLDASQQLEHLEISGDIMKKVKARSKQYEKKEEWLFENLDENYQIGDCLVDKNHKNADLREKPKADLPNVIKTLIGAIKHLEQKVQKLQNSHPREQESSLQTYNTTSSLSFERYANSSQKNISKSVTATQTYGSMPNNDTILIKFVELLRLQSELEFYREENKQLRGKLAINEASSENMEKMIRRYEGENSKLKELLKQYHNFKKKHGSNNSAQFEIFQNKDINQSLIISSRPSSTLQKMPIRFGNINLQQLRQKQRINDIEEKQREGYIRQMQKSDAKTQNIACLCKSFSKYIQNIEKKQQSEMNCKHNKERDDDSMRKRKGDNLFHSVKQMKYAQPRSFGQFQQAPWQNQNQQKNWSTLDSKQNYPSNQIHEKQQKTHFTSQGLNFSSLSSSKAQAQQYKSNTKDTKQSFVNSYRSPIKESSNQIESLSKFTCKSGRF